MIKAMHGLSTMHCNIKTDIRLARESGFEALEVVDSKLLRYMDCGYCVEELNILFEKYSIKPICINALKNVERVRPNEYGQLMDEAKRLIFAAEKMKCPTIQLVPFCGLEGRPWKEVLKLTARNIADIADIGKKHGIRFQLEPIAWSPIHSISQSLQVIEEAGRDNVGMVIDFWHLRAGGETTPDDVAELDKSIIYGVHFCDGVMHKPDTEWVEVELRSFLPGDGEIPVKEWVDAVKSTGFDGVWSSELLSPKHWEWDLLEIAKETNLRMEKYLTGNS
ncbi:MAG: sugar phosphate isomerase/epimerase family protein [Clostridiales bacterium]|nr:sugar phosphate isomerase/epimerase family protein [Clostridiales bacterium]